MRSLLTRTLPAAMLSILSAAAAYAGEIAVDNPFARASAGPAKVGAVFMTLKNSGAADDALVAAESPVAGRAELHMHIMDGDVVRMRQVPSIDLPAGGTVSLEPGGLHVMLIDLREPLKQGATFPLTLTFVEAGKVTIQVPVKSPAETAPTHGHQH